MTMHLEGPWLTTNNSRKRKVTLTKKQHAELIVRWKDRNRDLKQQGIKQTTFDEFLDWIYGRGTKVTTAKVPALFKPFETPKAYRRETQHVNSLPFTGGPCTKPEQKVYTGTKIKGIGTMHKSNAVPIFSDEEAEAIAHMRR